VPQPVTSAGTRHGGLEKKQGLDRKEGNDGKPIYSAARPARTRTWSVAGVAVGLVLGLLVLVVVRFLGPVSGAREIEIPPEQFTTQASGTASDIRDEFFFNTRENPIPGLRESEGVDLSPYDLEFTFQSAVEKAQVQLWYKGRDWTNVYSRPYLVTPGEPIRYNPFRDGRAVSQFDDFTHIWAIGAKVIGARTEEVQLTSARLVRR
jgi:hypothetical protein